MLVIRKIRYYLLTFLLLCSSRTGSFAQPANEYQVKAAFLFNFTHFIDWPSHAFSSTQSPMVIGVLGRDPFGRFLPQTIEGEKVSDHPLMTKYYSGFDDIQSCQILFININGKKKLEEVMTRLKGRSILTVSDETDFLLNGGMIRFFTRNNKILLEVNTEAMKDANLVISSALLRQVEIFSQKNRP